MFVKFPKFVQIGVLIGMLLIYGCASRDAARSEGNEVEYTGTLKSLGEVLVEEKHKGKWKGRTRTNKIVFFEDEADWHGRLASVTITKTSPWSLQGTLATV